MGYGKGASHETEWDKASKPWSLNLHEGIQRHHSILCGKEAMVSSIAPVTTNSILKQKSTPVCTPRG